MNYVFSNSKIPKQSEFKSASKWIHLIGGFGGNGPSRNELDGLEQYLPRDDFALRSSTRKKGGAERGNGSA
jgi:hypothetical protein